VADLGLLDTNILIHSLRKDDPLSGACRDILLALQDNRSQAIVDVLVIHESLYVLEALGLMPQRQNRATYLRSVLAMPGVACEHKDIVLAALTRWSAGSMSFVDAWLWTRARDNRWPVCTTNRRDFVGVRVALTH
jgi:predicted nucleic-acid-binding protein